jgi:hypothetical protein
MAGAEGGDDLLGDPGGRAGASFARRLVSAIGGVLLATGVVGTAISAYFQWRSWSYQTGVDRIDKDALAAVAALESLDKIVDEKFLSTYDMDDAIKSRLSGKELDAAVKRFYAANKEWEQGHAIIASKLQIAVDSKFGIRNVPLAAPGNGIDCANYLLKDQQPKGDEPISVKNLLEIAYNCHTVIKNKVDEQLRARDENRGQWPDAAVEPDPGRIILGHLWRLGNVLQCMMVERVLEIRNQSPRVPVIPLPDSGPGADYRATAGERANEAECVEPYKSDPGFGLASVKP